MSMYWAEQELRATGEPQDEAYANILAAIIDARGDVAFSLNISEVSDQITQQENEASTDDWGLSEFKLPDEVDSFFLSNNSRIGALSVESQIEKSDTETTIRAGAQRLVLPFTIAFGDLLPDAQSRVGKRAKKVKPLFVSETMNREGQIVPHDYKVSYGDEEGQVRLNFVTLSLGRTRNSYPRSDSRPSISVDYDLTSEPSSVHVRWGDDSLLLPKLLPKPLGDFMLRTFGVNRQGALNGPYLGLDRLSFVLGEHPHLELRGSQLAVNYSLDANNPSALSRTIATDDIEAIHNGEKLPAEISADQFIGMLYQALKLVPTIADSELLGK